MRSLLSIAFCGHLALAQGPVAKCVAGATIRGDALKGSVLAFDHYINYHLVANPDSLCRASSALFLEKGSPYVDFQYGLFEPVATDNALEGSRVSPICGISPAKLYSGTFDYNPVRICSPARYRNNPFICAAGDWSGKFGPIEILYGDAAAKKNGTASQWFESRENEEVRVIYDEIAVSPCRLAGLELRLYCPDGSLAACGKFQIISRAENPLTRMEAGFRFNIWNARELYIPTVAAPYVIVNDEAASPPHATPREEENSFKSNVQNWWGDLKKVAKQIDVDKLKETFSPPSSGH